MSRLRAYFSLSGWASLSFAFIGCHFALGADWPSFRGPDRSSLSPDKGLLQSWPEGGPKLIWEAKGAGRGYASVAIVGDRIFTLGDGADEYLTCFDRKTGNFIWRTKTGKAWTDGQESWRSSRGTPTVDGDRVYVITPFGRLYCCSVDDGSVRWNLNLKDDLGGVKGDIWGYSESVLIDGDKLICTPGGPKATVVALNKMDGKPIWTCVWPDNRGAGHSCVVISNVQGRKVYVQSTAAGALGVDPDSGKLLWTFPIDQTICVIPTPIIKDDYVFFVSGYGRGGALLRQVPGSNGAVDVEVVFDLKTELSNKHGGVVRVGDYIYGDSDDKGMPYCAKLMDGSIQWKERGSGKSSASVTAADGLLFIRYSNGMMTLVKADPSKFQEVGKFMVPGSGDRPSWAHPVVLDGRLYLREGDSILCYDVKGN